MSESMNGFTSTPANSEIAAQRLVLAALQGGMIKTSGFGMDEKEAKTLAEFLGTATTELAKRLKAG